MPTVEAAMTNLADLSKIALIINSESNEVNTILRDFEKKLVDMGLGVEASASTPLSVTMTAREKWDEDEIVCEVTRYKTKTYLGFGRIGDRYALRVKTLRFVDATHNVNNDDWAFEFESEEEPYALLQAPRELRVKALEQIEDLLEALVREAKRVITAIEKGRNTVKNL